GNGFFIPPHQSPIPPFRIDEPVDPARVEGADRTALANVNAALGSVGAARLERLEQAFESDQDFLCTFPELDHYGTRETSGYWGPRMRIDLGHVVDWPDGPGRRVFVYVKTSLAQLDALIDALVARPHRVLAFIPGLDERRRARLASASRRVLARPVRLDAALRGCDLLVSHGGEIAGGALCHGVPSLLFPSHYEQYLMALRQRQLGTGAWLPLGATAQDVVDALDGLLRDDRALGKARAFARRYPAWSPPEQRRRIVARIEELLAPARG
ncbi:MAG TPA: nucleotide disphospho-sugar-binding domain-containing protein, partial [Usitatibacter sp.]|nr:nucleotide disphospho-sugar-binding domain-containing protein [Usitatibacter sp.]